MKGIRWYNYCKAYEKLSHRDKLAVLSFISRVFPWYYMVGPMSRAERRFYSAKTKRPKDKKK